jgi:hypothetical protein
MGKDITERMVANCNLLREDLKVEIEKIDTKPGDTIIVKPRSNEVAFPDHYRSWIVDVLHALKPNVQIVVLMDNNLDIKVQKQEV